MSQPNNVGDMCVHCRQDTKFGSGKFVNRYPVFGLWNENLQREEDGYCCDECEDKYYRENRGEGEVPNNEDLHAQNSKAFVDYNNKKN